MLNKENKIRIIISIIVIWIPSFIYALGWSEHGSDICYGMLGYPNNHYSRKTVNTKVMVIEAGKPLSEAYEVMASAASVAIDLVDIYESNLGRFQFLQNKNPKLVPSKSIFNVKVDYGNAGQHRRVNHQGFDYDYKLGKDNKQLDKSYNDNEINELNRRWKVGRKLLIDAARYAFRYSGFHYLDEKNATFIAMNTYYIHLLGDLETANTVNMKPLYDYRHLLDDYIKCLNKYSKNLNGICQAKVSQMIIALKGTKVYQEEKVKIENSKGQTIEILQILHKYLPDIISQIVPSKYFTIKSLSKTVA